MSNEHDWEENFEVDENGGRIWYRCVLCQQWAYSTSDGQGIWAPDESDVDPCGEAA